MILVIGGAYQGKEEYVYRTLLQESGGQSREKSSEYIVINHYHLKVKEQLQAGLEPLKEAQKLLTDAGDKTLVVICDEVGYGVVPVDGFERAWREKVGRVCCCFAQKADQVIRVVCGVGNRIK